ncbi:hypothetical protein [Chryseobacterium lathyri]|uniref:hypothetical protein n=1 Tax=Chryseobacterium lathyri TaxID=395933 RepID=UPI001CBEF637|nr:hypothetical protein [Chryseobacterium lathyri]
MANVDTYTDEELKDALIKTSGQPTKAADMLGVTYISVYGRIRKNPELLDIQKSARQKTFQDISNFQVAAVLAGIVKSPEFDDEGSIKKDENGKVVYMDAVVGVNARMEYASRLMTLFKSDEGIKDETDVNIKTAVDTSKLSDDTLNDLMAALKNDEK